MKVIYNNFIPKHGFALNLFGILFMRNGDTPEPGFINHESIHVAQMKELGYVGFYIWYLVEWLIKLFVYGRKAYENISFEKEANKYRFDQNYLKRRNHYEWFSLITANNKNGLGFPARTVKQSLKD